MSGSSCKLAALPLIAAGHAGVACPGFPHIMQRLFSQRCLRSSGFSLLSGPRVCLLTRVAGGLVLLVTRGFAFIGSLFSLLHGRFRSSCLFPFRLLDRWVNSDSSSNESGLAHHECRALGP